ncbi:uncharacterized protein METZ01_LOCUS58405 [marine metagenome]|uniref:Uncharacterized protein n=1 Tax=marine metagenome TaxID=408172 RepID=A0A381SQE3_9ZZZZ
MPGKGYSTIGVKPAVMERLQQITDKNYLGMFLPSTLIIMMNEVKAERYTIHAHKLRLDLTGRYNTITIRSDIKEWLKSSYEDNKEEYLELYNVKCFTRFVSYFIVNMIESKNDLENNALKMNEGDFKLLHDEYKKRRKTTVKYRTVNFEQFVDEFVSEIIEKVRTARKVLTV